MMTLLRLLPYSRLPGGSYARDDRPPPTQYVGPGGDARLAALRRVADGTGATLHQVILAWMMQHARPVLPVFSASNVEQMAEDLGALNVTLSDEQRTFLDEAGA